MALVELPGDGLFYPHPVFPAASVPAFDTGLTFDASTDRGAIIFRANFTDAIDQIAVAYGAIATSAAMDYRIETVDTATDAKPTGTLWGTNTAATAVTPSANVVVAAPLTASASITKGQMVALVVRPNGVAAINVIVQRLNMGTMTFPGGNVPYSSANTTGAYANGASPIVAAVHLASANRWIAVSPSIPLIQSFQASVFNTGTGATTGTQRGMQFTLPVPARGAGIWWKSSTVASADFDVVLYDGTGATALQTLVAGVDASQQRASTGAGHWDLPFDATYDFAAHTSYIIAIVPSTVNSITMNEYVIGAAGHMDTFPGGQSFVLAKFVSSAWSVVATERPWMGLHLSHIDDGTGGGGGTTIAGTPMLRGMVG